MRSQLTTASDGDVTISGNVDGTNLADQSLIIDSGSGAVSIGTIGTTSATANVNKIEINKTDNKTGTIAVGNIGSVPLLLEQMVQFT